MMLTDKTFRDRSDRPLWPWQKGRVFEGMQFVRCLFENCHVSITRDPRRRSCIRDVRLLDCSVSHTDVDTAIVQDVTIDGLRTVTQLHSWGAVFRHVVFKGRIGEVMLSPAVAPGVATPTEQAAFSHANACFYAETDWALDITEAEFEEADLRGVPGHLVRRDPETQVLVMRSRAEEGVWKSLDLSATYWPTALDFFLTTTSLESIVLVAPKRARDFPQLLDGLRRLRDAGVAELD